MKNLFIFFFILALVFDISGQTVNTATNKTTPTSDNCNYFPVKNGLKFTYKRTNMMGEQTITETYTAVKEKILKSGKVVKGYKISSSDENRNNTVIYYYCEAGAVKMYSEMPDYNTTIKGYVEDYSSFPSDYNKPSYKKTPIWETEKTGSGKYLSFTELKDGNTGTAWTDVQVVNGNPVIISSTIGETDLTITVREQTYSSVVHIKRTVSVTVLGKTQELNTQDVYYAKGIGKIKTVETGRDLFMGNYTTTQEMVTHNLPAQLITSQTVAENNNKPTVNKTSTSKTSPYKLGESAIEAICDQWCGSYKLVEKDGKPVGDFPYGEYLHLETEGDAISIILQKKSGKLYETGKQTGLEWTVWMENNQQVIYIRNASETKGKPVSSQSVPRKTIIVNNKVYQYVNRELQYY